MGKYLKDPLDSKRNAYDVLSAGPHNKLGEIRQAYKKELQENPGDQEIDKSWRTCSSQDERINMDFFYYICDWSGSDE